MPQLFVTTTVGADGTNKGLALIVAGRLVQLPLFCVTVYVPAVVTVVGEVVAPFDHSKFEPVAVKVEFPQLSVAETIGTDGTVKGAAVTDEETLVHPPTVWVTVYNPPAVTVIGETV